MLTLKKLLKPIARRWPFPVCASLATGRMMYVDLRSAIGRGIYVTGQFDPAVFLPLDQGLSSGATFNELTSLKLTSKGSS